MIVEQDALKTSLQSTNLCKHQLIAGCKVLVILSPKDLHPVRKQLEEPWHKIKRKSTANLESVGNSKPK